jgi:hypothetical protein
MTGPFFQDTQDTQFKDTQDVSWQAAASAPTLSFQNAGIRSLFVGGFIQYTVLRTQGGVATDVTSLCLFSSSHPLLASVNVSGRVSGVSLGEVTITATYDGLTCTTICPEIVFPENLSITTIGQGVFPESTAFINAEQRVLSQFRQSPVLLSILMAFIGEVKVLQDAIRDVMAKRTLYLASGENLDVIGRIVGQLRGLINLTEQNWFTPDTAGSSVDQARVWVENAALEGVVSAPDVFSKVFIQGKIYRNNVRYGSIPEVQQFVWALFNIPISVIVTGPLTIDLVVPDSVSNDTLASLNSLVRLRTCESVYLLPVPAGVKIDNVIKFSDYSV